MQSPQHTTPSGASAHVTGSVLDRSNTDTLPSEHSCDGLLQRIRDLTYSPTTVSHILHSPSLLSKIESKRDQRASTSNVDEKLSDRTHSRRGHDGTACALTAILSEEEREAHRLRRLLHEAGDRLEYESRRADDVEGRASAAKVRATGAETRVCSEGTARHQAEMDAALAREENQRIRMLKDTVERDLQRTQVEVQELKKQLDDSRKKALESQDGERKAQQVLREHQVREEGRQEIRRLESARGVDEFAKGRVGGLEAGREEGYKLGRDEGYAEGYEAGQQYGYNQGLQAGRVESDSQGYKRGQAEEREYALKQFDKFLDSDAGRRSLEDYLDHGTRSWTSRIRHAEASPGSFRLYLEKVRDHSSQPSNSEQYDPMPVTDHMPATEVLSAPQQQSLPFPNRRSRESLEERIRHKVYRHPHGSAPSGKTVAEAPSSSYEAS